MSNNSKALKSGIWYTAASFVTKSIGLITAPIFTRMLTKSEFGMYNTYTSWLAIMTILVTFHLDSTFISARFDFKEKFDEYIGSTLMLSTVSAVLWMALVNVLSGSSLLAYMPDMVQDFFHVDHLYINTMMVYLLFLPAINMFQARERYMFGYKKSVLVSCLVAFSTTGLSVLLVKGMSNRLTGRVLGSAIPTIVIGLILFVYLLVKGKTIKISYWKYAFPICLPFIPHLLSLTILNSMDRIMITDICSAEDNALYSCAHTCSYVITILVTSLNSAFAPWLGEKLNEHKEDEIHAFSKKYVLIFAGLTLGIMLISPELILFVGGKSYMEAQYVMPPVMFGCVCQFMYTMFVNVEQFKKKTVGMAIASITAAVINYILNSLFIPRFGYIAAAYTTLISFLWLLLAHMLLVKLLGLSKVYDYSFILIVTGVMAIVTVGINALYKLTLLRYVLILIYAAVFGCVVWKYRNLILSLLKKKKKA